MRNLVILFVHVIATLARLWGPGGIRSVVAESVLVKQQLLILNRSRQRSPHLRTSDRLVAGLCALLIRPARLIRSAIVLKPSTLLSLHQALRNRKYCRLFSSQRRGRPGPKGPTKELRTKKCYPFSANNSLIIRLPPQYADDNMICSQHQAEADRFLEDFWERLGKFGLDLHPDKKRRIEFGRYAETLRKRRGEGTPEAFDFMGFPDISLTSRQGGTLP
jgi:hypothetical protein